MRKAFAGKIVLLGSALAFDDMRQTPIGLGTWLPDEARSPGVLVLALQIRSLMAQRLLQSPQPLVSMALALLLALTWFLRPGWAAWMLVLALVTALLAGGLRLLRAGWVVPSVELAASALLGLGGRTAVGAWAKGREHRRLRATFDGFVSPMRVPARTVRHYPIRARWPSRALSRCLPRCRSASA